MILALDDSDSDHETSPAFLPVPQPQLRPKPVMAVVSEQSEKVTVPLSRATRAQKPSFIKTCTYEKIFDSFKTGKAVFIQGEYASRWDILLDYVKTQFKVTFCIDPSSFENEDVANSLLVQLQNILSGSSLKKEPPLVIIEDVELVPSAMLEAIKSKIQQRLPCPFIAATHDYFKQLNFFLKHAECIRLYQQASCPTQICNSTITPKQDKFASSFVFASEMIKGKRMQKQCDDEEFTKTLFEQNYPNFCKDINDLSLIAENLSDLHVAGFASIDSYCMLTSKLKKKWSGKRIAHKARHVDVTTRDVRKKLRLSFDMWAQELAMLVAQAACSKTLRDEFLRQGLCYEDLAKLVKEMR